MNQVSAAGQRVQDPKEEQPVALRPLAVVVVYVSGEARGIGWD